jgi:hypothetical protein
MLKFLTISSLLLLATLCSAQEIPLEAMLITGYWENTEDTKATLTITDQYIIEKYNGTLIDTFSYRFNYVSCDTLVKDTCALNTMFIFETNIHNGYSYCYHLAVDETSLKLVYVFNHYEAVFRRRK